MLVTLLAPPSATEGEIARIADDLASAAERARVDILGGHTEVTDAVTRYTTCASVIARMSRDRILIGMQAGDDIVMTKWAGLEGTAIILADHAQRLSAVPPVSLDLDSALSVVPESRTAMRHGAHAMHDVTEGGVLGALWEMVTLYGCGIRLDGDSIPMLDATQAICSQLGLNPLRLIGSGSMLIACPDGPALVTTLQKEGIHAARIGRAEGEALLDQNGHAIAPPGADEIYCLS
jgi:hydrogenase maturation factor